MVGQLLDNGDVFFEALHLDVFLEHFDEALEDELLEELVVDFRIRDFPGQGGLDILLNSFDILMPEFHFGHSGFVNFSTFHDFDFGFKVLLLFVEI